MVRRPDAAILLIGNELLSGRVRDDNLHFLAAELWELGVPVRTAWMIRDGIDEIGDAVRRLADSHTWLFTTGGIGPTHDDLTIEGVAHGFGLDVVNHPRLESLIRGRLGGETTDAHLRMARVPDGAVLAGGEEGAWPTVRVRNVFILPGVPSILRRKFRQIRESFRQSPLHRRILSLATTETAIAGVLERAAAAHPEIEIGSYPQAECVLVTFEGADEAAVETAYESVSDDTGTIPRV